MRIFRAAAALLICTSLYGVAPATAPAENSGLGPHLAPCMVPQTKIAAECGTFGVYENREARSGRTIQLNLIVVPAVHPQHRAIAEIAGGPGQPVTPLAPYFLSGQAGKARPALHQTYDFIFMDDRGIMGSNAFSCNFTPPNDPAAYFRFLFPPKIVQDCRLKSAATHNLPFYNTNNAVDDLDGVRAGLGYQKIVVSGGSYGTLFALVYVRRHGDHVESALLDGVAPPGFQPIPGEPVGAQRALDDLFRKCRTNAFCESHFPQFKPRFYALMKRLSAGPLEVPAENLTMKKTQTVALSKEVFVDTLRHLLYDPEGASYVPYVIDRAYTGDYKPLAKIMQLTIADIFGGQEPVYLAYSCSDMLPFISPTALRYAAEHSFTGDLRIRAQRQACKIWDVPAMPPSFNTPVHSNVPALMILGSDDPGTPAQYGLAALKYLPNGRAILVKGGGHGADTSCTDALVLQFVLARSANGLDVNKCSASFKLPPFATSLKGLPPLQ